MAAVADRNPKGLRERKVNSYGIIPVRCQDGVWEAFIIQQRAGHWCFSKGHPDPNETQLQTAYRELKEETNLKVKKILFDESILENYERAKAGYWEVKTVTLWIAEILDASVVKLQKEEVSDCKWVPVSESDVHVTYEHCKEAARTLQAKMSSLKSV